MNYYNYQFKIYRSAQTNQTAPPDIAWLLQSMKKVKFFLGHLI